MTPQDRQVVTRAEFGRAEEALAEKLKARDEVVDKSLTALAERIEHKHRNAMQAINGFRELAQVELRPLTSGDESVPVLRVRIRHLEEAREEDRKRRDEDRQRIDELRMGSAKIAALLAFAASFGGFVTWLMQEILGQ